METGAELCIARQNLVESWVVATRPLINNGLALPPSRVAAELRAIQGLFRLLEGKAGVTTAWERLVREQAIAGKLAHDAHLVAVMQVYGVTGILTFNVADFRRFSGITVFDPEEL